MDTVARWHPWMDRPGQRHTGTIWDDCSIWKDAETFCSPQSADEAIFIVGREQLYVYCSDIMDDQEFPWSDDLLLHLKSDVYVQKKGSVVAVRVKSGRYCGFFIPSRTWGFNVPDFDMIDTINAIFELFKYEAITPASLAEKVARGTMGERIAIFRPACHLREILLKNNGGGRIDLAEDKFYKTAYKYDRRKAYLSFAYAVPDPRFPPKYHIRPRESWLYDYPTPGYWRVSMVAHGEGLHPIFLNSETGKRFPKEGEQFEKWLWRDEILACELKGYTLLFIHEGYRWTQSSDILKPWSDLMWEKFQKAQSEEEERIIKSMIVGFFGRCLAEPTNHFLIPFGQQKKGDIAIPYNRVLRGDFSKEAFTKWYLRAEYNQESTALTPIGAWIIAQCRLEMYRLAAVEEAKGNRLISSYIDSATFEYPASSLSLGPLPGQYSEEKLTNVWAHRNSLIGELDGEVEMCAPGYEQKSESRLDLLRKYNQFRNDPKYC